MKSNSEGEDALELIARIKPFVATIDERKVSQLTFHASHEGKSYGLRRLNRSIPLFAASLAVVLVVGGIVLSTNRDRPSPTINANALTLRSGRILVGPMGSNSTGLQPGQSGKQPIDYQFSAGENLSTSSGSATAYQLQSPTSVASTAQELASALSVPSTQSSTYFYSASTNLPVWHQTVYQVGSSIGPRIMTFISNGVMNWVYQQPDTNTGSTLPDSTAATSDALSFLSILGINSGLVDPTSQVNGDSISVYYSLSIGSIVPLIGGEQGRSIVFGVTFGPGSVVESAYGVEVTATPIASYPTISATDAVAVLQSTKFYSPDSAVAGPTSPQGPSSSQPIDVTIDEAMSGLAAVNSADGTTILVPTWTLVGGGQFDSVISVQPSLLSLSS